MLRCSLALIFLLGFVRTTSAQIPTLDQVRSEWQKLSPSELSCIDRALRQHNVSVEILIARGVLPNNPPARDIRYMCGLKAVPDPQLPSTALPPEDQEHYSQTDKLEISPNTAVKSWTCKVELVGGGQAVVNGRMGNVVMCLYNTSRFRLWFSPVDNRFQTFQQGITVHFDGRAFCDMPNCSRDVFEVLNFQVDEATLDASDQVRLYGELQRIAEQLKSLQSDRTLTALQKQTAMADIDTKLNAMTAAPRTKIKNWTCVVSNVRTQDVHDQIRYPDYTGSSGNFRTIGIISCNYQAVQMSLFVWNNPTLDWRVDPRFKQLGQINQSTVVRFDGRVFCEAQRCEPFPLAFELLNISPN